MRDIENQGWLVAKIAIPILTLFILCLVGISCCTRVPAGYTGIKVNMYGDDRGVSDKNIVTGWVFYNPFSQKIYKFPTFMQTAVWTKDSREGSRYDESITFQTNDGLTINADIGMNYYFISSKVPQLFVKFRRAPKQIEATYLRTKVREAFVYVASNYTAEEFIKNKARFLKDVRDFLCKKLENDGFKVDTLSFIGSPRVPRTLLQSIEAKIKATQLAEQKKRELEQARADAEKLVAKKQGEARARIAEAEGIAKARLIQAEAIAKANKMISQSLTKELILYEAIKKWNGIQPTVVGANGLILDLSKLK